MQIPAIASIILSIPAIHLSDTWLQRSLGPMSEHNRKDAKFDAPQYSSQRLGLTFFGDAPCFSDKNRRHQGCLCQPRYC